MNKSLFLNKEMKKKIRNKNMHLIDTFTQGCGKIIHLNGISLQT